MQKDHPSAWKDNLSVDESKRSEMAQLVKRLAFPSAPGESIKSCMRRVQLKTGLTFGQVKRLWHQEWKIIPATVADELRKRVALHEQRLDGELQELKKRYWALNHQSNDPEFYSVRTAQGDSAADDLG